jgi:hypothetical protein
MNYISHKGVVIVDNHFINSCCNSIACRLNEWDNEKTIVCADEHDGCERVNSPGHFPMNVHGVLRNLI